MPLQIRRGTQAELSAITPILAEPIYTTDTKKLFIGDGTTVGGIAVTGSGFTGSAGYTGSAGSTGYTGSRGADGQTSNYFNYTAKTSATSGNPGSGNFYWNAAIQTATTVLLISHIDGDGIDINLFNHLLNENCQVIVQDRSNSANYQIFTVTAGITEQGAYDTVPVTFDSAGGTGITGFANNHPMTLIYLIAGQVGPTGETGFTGSRGDTGPQGPQGPAGFTGSSGIGTAGYTGSAGGNGYTGSAGSYNQSLNTTDSVTFSNVTVTNTVTTTRLNSFDVVIDGGGRLSQPAGGGAAIQVRGPQHGATAIVAGPANLNSSTSWVSAYDTTSTFGELSGAVGVRTISGGSYKEWIFKPDGSLKFPDGTSISSATGLQGYSGSAGYNGSKGDTGFTGSQGIAGYNGSTGAQGDQGTTGFTGSAGTNGFTGSKGDTGFTGSQGLGFAPQSTNKSLATDGLVVGTNINWYVADYGSFAVGNFINLVDQTSGSTYFYGGKITLIQYAGGFGWAIHADIIDARGIPNGSPSSSWVMELTGTPGLAGVPGYTGSRGFTGSAGTNGDTGFTGSQGIQGVTGPQGPQGDQGATGFTGSKGDTGLTGPQGPQGDQGAVGFTGSQGIQGVTGFTGSKGDTGSTGPQGPQGEIGVTGFTGSAGTNGTNGDTGFTGSKGDTGSTGPQGPQGDIGATGFTGSAGTNGAAGYNGSQGTAGYNGSVGYTGSVGQGFNFRNEWTIANYLPYDVVTWTGSTYICILAAPSSLDIIPSNTTYWTKIAAKGDIGYTGSFGVTGYTGSVGTNGTNGFTGSKGDTGSQGATGYNGSRGIGYDAYSTTSITIGTGSKIFYFTPLATWGFNPGSRVRIISDTGLPSNFVEGVLTAVEEVTGTIKATVNVDTTGGSGTYSDWRIDIAGNVGFTGSVGSTGSTGFTGSVGTNGTNGAAGYNGSVGYTGSASTVSGPSGPSGPQGAAGYNGSVGYTGSVSTVSGPSGPSGPQGPSGYTGSVGGFGSPETIYSLGTTSGTIAPNFTNGTVQTITLNGNLTLNAFTSPVAGQSITLIVTQDGTGTRTLTSSMKFAGGNKILSALADSVDMITIFYDGTNYYASLTKAFV